jgi:2-polyprenyl-3-methyl-5-hydroxy-6-metoxy-1,4-benzoquinol methylase
MTGMPSDAEIVDLQRALYTSRNPTRRWLHTSRRDIIIDAVRKCALRGVRGRALEVGFGSGVYLSTLAEHFEQVVCSDVESTYFNHSKPLALNYPNVSLVYDDITRTKLPRSSFDVILCTEVIEHIPDSTVALANMHDLLKPGGTLVLSTPQPYCPLEIAAKIAFLPGIINMVRLIYQEPILETGHINLMSSQKVVGQLERAGFTIREAFKSGMYVPLIAEFAGQRGLQLEKWLEGKLKRGPLDWLIWTQYYIADA